MNRRQRRALKQKNAAGAGGPDMTRCDGLLAAATEHHRQGRMAEAETIYRRVIAEQPGNVHALHLLGLAADQAGRNEEGIRLMREAVRLKPDYPEARSNLGNAFRTAGRPEDAIQEYEAALELAPEAADTLNNLGNVLRETGRHAEAIKTFEKALRIAPDHALIRTNLGNAQIETGQLDQAVVALNSVVERSPDFADAYYNLGIAYERLQRLDEAKEALEKCLELSPRRADARCQMGFVYQSMGKIMEAQVCYHVVFSIEPRNFQAHYNLGKVLTTLGKYDEAIGEFKKSLEVEPENIDALGKLGTALRRTGKYDEAFGKFHEALEIDPYSGEIHNDLGAAYQSLGDNDKAAEYYQKTLLLAPDAECAEKNYLFILLNQPGHGSEELFELHRAIRGRHDKPEVKSKTFPDRVRDPEKRLRIGYVSSDFRTHVVALNIMPLIINHAHDQFEIYLYAEIPHPDPMTKLFQSEADHWRSIVGKSDAQAAAMIEDDEIDILVFLAGRFDGNRPLIATHRPAPIQVSYHDCATSGLEAMDYWLTDHLLHPEDTPEKFTEELYRLPIYYQYGTDDNLPEIAPLPALSNGYVTFASFNKPEKINDQIVKLWAEVLNAVPNSRLLLKYFNLYNEPSLQAKWESRFGAHGIAADRLILKASTDNRLQHLELVQGADIALDPFPFNGATTTYEALTMGLPVVTLLGRHFVDRVAASIVTHCGYPELIANTPEDYVARAKWLAENLDRLQEMRGKLRHEVFASPLCDSRNYALQIEIAFKDMWRRWCRSDARQAITPAQAAE